MKNVDKSNCCRPGEIFLPKVNQPTSPQQKLNGPPLNSTSFSPHSYCLNSSGIRELRSDVSIACVAAYIEQGVVKPCYNPPHAPPPPPKKEKIINK